MKNTNIVVVDGNLTKDAEVKAFTNSKKLNLNIAINITDKQVLFMPVIKWGDVDKYAELKKGEHVKIFGYLISESWEKDGKKQSIVKINAEYIETFAKKENTSSFNYDVNPSNSFTSGENSNNTSGVEDAFIF